MVKSNKIYLDFAASAEANPSSIHSFGIEAKKKLQNARAAVASTLFARPEEIIFTSGGTESNNLAIQGVVNYIGVSYVHRKLLCPHIITTNIEHPSVLETFKMLAKRKLARISIIPVEANGIVDPEKIKKEIKKNTVLISVHYANNEIGTIQPIKEIAKVIRHYKKTHLTPSPLSLSRRGVGERFSVFHTDAVQAGNYLDLNVARLGVDMLTLSGSKIEGAGRVGALYKKKSVLLAKIFGGGDQEMGLRPGTENLLEILKFSDALKSAQKIKEKESKKLTKLRDYFINKINYSNILENIGIVLNGDMKNRLPNNVNITIPNIPSDLLVIELSVRGIMASAKSACKSGDGKASYVIQAVNPKVKETDGSLRFSLGRETTKADVNYTVKSLYEILTKLKKWYS